MTMYMAAHALGRAHADRSGFEGPWTKEPLVFDNRYPRDKAGVAQRGDRISDVYAACLL